MREISAERFKRLVRRLRGLVVEIGRTLNAERRLTLPSPMRTLVGLMLSLTLLSCATPTPMRNADGSTIRMDVIVDKAVKGSAASAPIRGTKTRKGKRLPVGEVVADWIDRHVDPKARLRGDPLFVNPRTGRRWSHWALRDRWIRAGKAVGVENVRLYEGTKHTMATNAVRRGVSERALQRFLGHADLRSTRRYAKMADEALVTVLRPVVASTEDEDLSRTCPADFSASSNIANMQKKMASQSHSSWNRTWEWLREVEGLRRSLSGRPGTAPDALDARFDA